MMIDSSHDFGNLSGYYIKYLGEQLQGCFEQVGGWLVVLFYGISTLFGLVNAESSHFDENFVLVWFDLVLWHINHYWLFNAKSIFIHINSSIYNYSV